MNALQIMRKARFEVDALRTGNVASAMWDDEEILDSLNTASDSAARIMRLSDSHHVTKALRSDAGTSTFPEEAYATTSFRIVTDTTDYTLPPDLVHIVALRPLTTGYDGVRFRPAPHYYKHFIDQISIPSAELTSIQEGEAVFWYSRIGTRTLRIAPLPKDTIDIELVYHYRLPKLYVYTTGTVTTTYGSTSVVGSLTDWSSDVRTPADLVIVSTGASTPTSANVSLGTAYRRVSSITDDSTIALAKAYPTTSLSAVKYALAMIPVLPEEHHAWLAQMTAAIMLRKVSLEASEMAKASLEKALMLEVQPETSIGQMQESVPVEPFEIP